jgi:hypothetical protein
LKTKAKSSIYCAPSIKVKALLNGMNCNSSCEIKNKEFVKVMEIYDSLQTASYMNKGKEADRFYNGCMMEVSSKKSIRVFGGYAILNENNKEEVRLDKDNRLEKYLLKNLNISPMVKSLMFELLKSVEIH